MQVTGSGDEYVPAAGQAEAVPVLESMARGVGMEGHCIQHLEVEVAERAMVVAELEVGREKQQAVVMHHDPDVGLSFSSEMSWEQSDPVAMPAVAHLVLLPHRNHQPGAVGSARSEAIS